ncbi:SLBB domain-containing protein [Balnearium lithotrophicum]|nr:SLBB domain-containing protein [Balnearium lithotrophicum]
MNKKLKDGDLVFIKQIVDIPENAVSVEGYTTYPGLYEYKPGEKLSEILKPDMFFPDSNMRFALIERRYPLGSLPKYLTFSPEDVLKGKKDLELKPKDRIILYKFKEKEIIDFNKVKDAFLVKGEIKYPGIYAYKRGMKLSDILNRDMLTLNTNLYYAEVERRDLKTLEVTGIERFAPIDILNGKKDLTINRLDIIKFYPKYIYPPIRVSGLIKKSYYLPYHKGLKLSEALSSAKFTEDIRKLKVVIFRQIKEGQPEEQGKLLDTLGRTRSKEIEVSRIEDNNTIGLESNLFEPVKEMNSIAYTQGTRANEFLSENKMLREEPSDNEEESTKENIKNSKSKTQIYAASVFLYDLLVKKNSKVDILLKPGDKLVIQKVKPDEMVEKVTVSGYVRKPGVYKINEKTTLYDVLKAAGGFRENAYPQGIVVLRESVKKCKRKGF